MKQYDYLIVGAGLSGAVFAHELAARGKRCLVIDRRGHVAGNAGTETVAGIQVHKYGAHIFHTCDEEVWNYVNQFAEFNHYIHAPVAKYGEEVYSLPFNMNTFSQMWGVKTPEEAREKIAEQVAELANTQPANLEEQALRLVGRDVYTKLVKGYTEKQWGRDCRELPAFIIRRLPCRFTYDNSYFDDPYQGIPVEGYTAMVENMLRGTEVRLNTDYFEFIRREPELAYTTVYTGCIDEFFGYRLGPLQYRSLRLEREELPQADYQGNAVVNYTHRDVPYTRVIEHKHFLFGRQPNTVITREYPEAWRPGLEPYYPVNDEANNALYEEYKKLAAARPDVVFAGRLGEYRYYDMDKVIRAALDAVRQLEGGFS